MTDEEKQIIKEAIQLSLRYGNGGVRTFVDPDGHLTTNYTRFRRHQWNWTEEYCKYTLEVWREESAAISV